MNKISSISLTPRMQRIVLLLACSWTRKEIASVLRIGQTAVDFQIARASERIGLKGSNDVAGITRYAIASGLVKLWRDECDG